MAYMSAYQKSCRQPGWQLVLAGYTSCGYESGAKESSGSSTGVQWRRHCRYFESDWFNAEGPTSVGFNLNGGANRTFVEDWTVVTCWDSSPGLQSVCAWITVSFARHASISCVQVTQIIKQFVSLLATRTWYA